MSWIQLRYSYECACEDPFTEEHVKKWGNPSAGYQAMIKAHGTSNKPVVTHVLDAGAGPVVPLRRSVRATRGIIRPQRGFKLVEQAVQEADQEFLDTAVPPKEMAAALIDGGLSEDSESDSDTPNPSPMQSFIEEGFISPDSTAAGTHQQEPAEEIEEGHWSTADQE